MAEIGLSPTPSIVTQATGIIHHEPCRVEHNAIPFIRGTKLVQGHKCHDGGSNPLFDADRDMDPVN